MDRFVYSAGEMELGSSQCDLCIHQIKGNTQSCEKFEKIPEDVLRDEVLCPCVRNAKFLDL